MVTEQSVLVTGATGFIGQHLCRALAKEGFQVYGLRHASSTKDSPPPSKSPGIRMIDGDIRDIGALLPALTSLDIAAVVHLAARIPPRGEEAGRELECFQTNVQGTFNMLHACRELGVEHFIFASTQGVYGRTARLPASENDRTAPGDFYGLSKLQGEQLCQFFSEHHQLKMIVLRYAGVFGPGKNDGAVHNFFQSAFRGQAPPISGGGNQSRDFVYVGDIVAGTIAALKNVNRTDFAIYNLGGGSEVTVSEMARAIYSVAGCPLQLEGDVFPARDRFCLDISRAQRDLNYSPTPLEQALREMAGRIGCATGSKL